MKKICFFSFMLAFLLTPLAFSQSAGQFNTFRNPVITGAFPDPSILRVGENYFAAGTSGNSVPVYPLYQSNDLINWNRIGAVFNEPPAWTNGNFWAPELFYNNGTYFVYYTARRKSDNIACVGVGTTKDLSKGFKDNGIIIDWGKEAIDAFVFRDTDGKLYITWKAYGLNKDRPVELLTSELSADGLSLTGEHFSLTRYDKGWKGHGDDEGPCLVKHGEYYYLFYSGEGCCNNRCGYKVFVSRAKSLRGDWEQLKDGAILQGGEDWKCSGHGTVVQTPDKRYFFLYHAFNSDDFEYIGRQGLLDELLWDAKTGWPYFKYGNTPSSQAEVPFKNTVQKRELIYFDNFTSDSNLKFWQYDISDVRPDFHLADSTLILKTSSSPVSFIGINPKSGNYTAETCIVNRSENFKGLSINGHRSNLLAIGTQGSKIILYQLRNGARNIIAEYDMPEKTGKVYLRVNSTNARLFRFSWSLNQKDWTQCRDKNNNTFIDGTSMPGALPGLLVESGAENTGVFSFMRLDYVY